MGTEPVLQPGHRQATQHCGDDASQLPKDDPWQALKQGLEVFEPGFVLTRELPQEPVGGARGDMLGAAPAPFTANANPSAN